MSIGYAYLNIGTPNTKIRSVMQRNATPEKLTEVTAHNLEGLEKMIEYNSANDIKLFRISSDLIPFGSTPAAMAARMVVCTITMDIMKTKKRNHRMRGIRRWNKLQNVPLSVRFGGILIYFH